jgi:hypothetical protein
MLKRLVPREDILGHSYALARANQGAPGVDGQTFEEIESIGRENWLAGGQGRTGAGTRNSDQVLVG